MSTLAKRLKREKYNKGLDSNFTMKTLSEVSGIPLTLLNTIFYQGYIPRAEILLKIAKALDMHPTDALILAKKITPKMMETIFADFSILQRIYEKTYNVPCREFPPDEELVPITHLTD